MKAVFHGERNTAANGSFLTGVYAQQLTPPEDDYATSYGFPKVGHVPSASSAVQVTGWMEFWDYLGGASLRAFVAETEAEKSLFCFFDVDLVGRDLRKAMEALIELAEGPLGCSNIVICIDRSTLDTEVKPLMKSLQWVGFELTTLDHWAKELDVTSDRWLFMGMEV